MIGVLAWAILSNRRTGEIAAIAQLDPEDVIDNAVMYFASDGWQVSNERGGWAYLQKGPSGGTGCLWLILFFPIGLAYLFTDWGKGSLTIRAEEDNDTTHVLIQWQEAEMHDAVQEFVRWLQSR